TRRLLAGPYALAPRGAYPAPLNRAVAAAARRRRAGTRSSPRLHLQLASHVAGQPDLAAVAAGNQRLPIDPIPGPAGGHRRLRPDRLVVELDRLGARFVAALGVQVHPAPGAAALAPEFAFGFRGPDLAPAVGRKPRAGRR